MGPVSPQRQPLLGGQGGPLPAALLAPEGVAGRLPPPAHPLGLSGDLRCLRYLGDVRDLRPLYRSAYSGLVFAYL